MERRITQAFIVIAVFSAVLVQTSGLNRAAAVAQLPNIVFIIGEDLGPELGCYGDNLARTPNIDRLAREGARFTRAFTHAPVCAPSRSGLITGQYPTTIGSHHMRSKLINPPETFISLMRQAGYYVAWPGKTDFNFDPVDPNSGTAGIAPPEG